MASVLRRNSGTALALCCMVLALASPADARRRVRFGSFGGGSNEYITLVFDLPNEDPYIKQGNFFDVGWLHSPSRSGYVIYHKDRFTKLDDADIKALTAMLGVDPTAAHRARQASAASATEEARDDLDGAAKSNAASMGSKASDKLFGAGGISFIMGMLSLLWYFRKPLFRRNQEARAARIAAIPIEPPVSDLDTGSFDEKVARRLAQLQQPPAAPAMAPAAAAPPARGFGRKAA